MTPGMWFGHSQLVTIIKVGLLSWLRVQTPGPIGLDSNPSSFVYLAAWLCFSYSASQFLQLENENSVRDKWLGNIKHLSECLSDLWPIVILCKCYHHHQLTFPQSHISFSCYLRLDPFLSSQGCMDCLGMTSRFSDRIYDCSTWKVLCGCP